MDQKSRTKLDRMAKYYPETKIVLVTAKEYRGLRQVASIIPHWEHDKLTPPNKGRIHVLVEEEVT